MWPLFDEFFVEAIDVALHVGGDVRRLVAEASVGVVVQTEMAIGEITVGVGVVVAGAEPFGPLAAHLDHLIDQGTSPVLGEGVALAETQASPIAGDDVGDAVGRAGDRRLVGAGRGNGGGRGRRCGRRSG